MYDKCYISSLLPSSLSVHPGQDFDEEEHVDERDHQGCLADQLQVRWRALGTRDTGECAGMVGVKGEGVEY